MQAVWVSLKENVNCVSKLTDVVGRPENNCRKKGYDSRNENFEKELVCQLRNPFREALFRPNYPKTQFYELNIGDPSRNIIELIFQRASMDPSKLPWKIKRVLRVKNSIEVLESRKLKQVSELCKDPSCRACRIIHSRFDMEFTRKNGIRLSTSSEEVNDSMVSFKLKNLKRAVIVCRVIAGRIANTIDGVYEEFDSVGVEGPKSNLEYLIVQNPCAILPCFVIVFD
ncbi:hypothetical protein REPUB_Repub18cG0011300 [Reevesia pubescens]